MDEANKKTTLDWKEFESESEPCAGAYLEQVRCSIGKLGEEKK